MRYFLHYFLPGMLLIGFAFVAGSQKNVTIGMFGFLCFFTIGVMLIIEGKKKKKE